MPRLLFVILALLVGTSVASAQGSSGAGFAIAPGLVVKGRRIFPSRGRSDFPTRLRRVVVV